MTRPSAFPSGGNGWKEEVNLVSFIFFLALICLPFIALGMGTVIVMRAIHPTKPKRQKAPVPAWRYVVAILLSPVVFFLALMPMAIFGQIFNDVPARQAYIPIIAEVSIPLAVTIYVFRGVIRPQPGRR